jgi:hypothetical protein
MSARDDFKKLIINHRRRLQKLRERQALEGMSVDPRVLIEIEDIEARLAELQLKLKKIRKTRQPRTRTLASTSRVVVKPLSARQQAVLNFIESFIAEKGLSPTLEEIRVALKISSKSVVHHYLVRLEQAGYLTRLPNTPRGIRLR